MNLFLNCALISSNAAPMSQNDSLMITKKHNYKATHLLSKFSISKANCADNADTGREGPKLEKKTC